MPNWRGKSLTDIVDLPGSAPAVGIHLSCYVHTPPENDSELTKQMREFYDPKVPRQAPITDRSLIGMSRRISSKYPRRIALDPFGATTSYRELAHRVQPTAALLREYGVERGDRVSLVAPNCPQLIYVLYVCLQVGAVAVLHNPLATLVELKWQFENAKPKLIFAWQKTIVTIHEVAVKVAAGLISIDVAWALPRHLRLSLQLLVKKARDLCSRMCDAAAKDLPGFNDLLVHCKPFNRIICVDPDIPAVLLHTGDTTGKPKAVILTNRNLVSNLRANITWVMRLREGQEIWHCVLPFFHAFGLTLSLNGNLASGGMVVLFPKFDVEGILYAQRRRPGTLTVEVPPISDCLAKAAVDNPKVDLRSFSYTISGAMPLTKEADKHWEDTTRGYLTEGYGMTEISLIVLGPPISPGRRLGYMGIVFPSIQVRVVDPESNQDVEPGQIGEPIAKGPGCSPGYWCDQIETDLLPTADGRLKTGDLVEENDYFLKMSDRRKELIIISGFNIYPSVVETVIVSMPQVQEVAAVGIPDQVDAARGEQVHAAIVSKPGASLDLDKIRSWASEVLPRYAMPRSVSFPESLEKDQTGKIQRRKVHDSVLKGLS